MKNILLSLLVSFSLLAAPVAHAAGFGCAADNCQISETAQKLDTHGSTQDKTKVEKLGHHCCSHVSIKQEVGAVTYIASSIASAGFYRESGFASSLVIGPPLKPPSLA